MYLGLQLKFFIKIINTIYFEFSVAKHLQKIQSKKCIKIALYRVLQEVSLRNKDLGKATNLGRFGYKHPRHLLNHGEACPLEAFLSDDSQH